MAGPLPDLRVDESRIHCSSENSVARGKSAGFAEPVVCGELEVFKIQNSKIRPSHRSRPANAQTNLDTHRITNLLGPARAARSVPRRLRMREEFWSRPHLAPPNIRGDPLCLERRGGWNSRSACDAKIPAAANFGFKDRPGPSEPKTEAGHPGETCRLRRNLSPSKKIDDLPISNLSPSTQIRLPPSDGTRSMCPQSNPCSAQTGSYDNLATATRRGTI
jgi:hypothetical protein